MDALLTIVGLGALVIGAEVMIRGAVEIALRARISPLVVGLTVVSLGTSVPELLVSLLAALKGSPAIAIGNVVGSNIVNISLVLGLSILIMPIEVDRDARRIHWPVMMLVTIAFIGLLWDDEFTRWEGIIFTLLLATYVVGMVRSSRKKQALEGSLPPVSAVPIWRSLLMLIIGIAALGFGADRFVEGAVGLARTFGVSDQLIGVTIVAVGTSLPELITSVMAAIRRQPDISLGNLVGSNIFNLLGIVGVTATVHPIIVDHRNFMIDLLAMFAIALLLFPLMKSVKLGRWQGAILCILYAV
ncbi:MAG: calcium/sodium antiporter [Bacteroidota bacterium]|nr:calcium/sodium antiporter [Bacteroidota bacterium]